MSKRGDKIGEALGMILISLIPGIILAVVFWFRFMRGLLPPIIWFTIIGIGYWAGKSSYPFFDDLKAHTENLPTEEQTANWGAFFASCIIGFTVILFLRFLFTHELVRNLDSWDEPR